MSEKGTCDNPERPWTYVCKCLRIATKGTKVGSTATVPGTVYLAYPILPFGIVKCTFFQTTFLQQLLTEHNENTIAAINHQRARQIKFRDNSRLFIFRGRNWPLSRGYFGSWGHALLAVAIVERFKQESMYGLFGKRSTRKRRPKNEAPKSRKRST